MKYFLIVTNQDETLDPEDKFSENLQVLDLIRARSIKHVLKIYESQEHHQTALTHYWALEVLSPFYANPISINPKNKEKSC